MKWLEFYSFDRLIFLLFLISIILIRIPPFYILPISTNLFSSHSLSKILIVLLFVTMIVIKKKINWGVSTIGTIIIFLYFLGQSLSIITARDIVLFWESYQNIISFIFIFLLASYFSTQNSNSVKLFKYIVILGVVLTGLELICNIFPEALITIGRSVIQQEVLNAYITNISRNRYSLEVSLEIFLPFFLFFLSQKGNVKKVWKVIVVVAAVMLMYNSIFSNIRSRILLLLMALFFSIWAYLRARQNKFTILKKGSIVLIATLVLSSTFFVATYVSNSLFSFSVINRILLEDPNEDLGTLNSRVEKVNRAWDLFQSSPVFGVGLGNYVYNTELNNMPVFYSANSQSQVAYFDTARELPHNIFSQVLSETGFIGFLSYMLLLTYFVVKDWYFLKKREWNIVCCYSISSWVIIAYGIFNPASTIFIMGWFWFFRGVIEGQNVTTQSR